MAAPRKKSEPSALTWMDVRPVEYDTLLAEKVTKLRERFAHLLHGCEPDVFASPPTHFRHRCRFVLARLPAPGDEATLPMNRPLQYALFDSGAPSVAVREFPIASSAINELMPRLLAELNARAPLAAGIAAVHFLSTQAGDMLVSLIYAEPLHARWRDEALKMQRALKLAAVVGRAKGTCVKLPRDWVVESYALADGRRLRYQQLEGAFSNPSAAMAEHTLSWLCAAAADIVAAAAGSGGGAREPPSLLELYCGNGNHTVALAPLFKRLLAVEIDARLCAAAVGNLKENGVDDRNVRVLCAPSARFCGELLRRINRPAAAAPAAAPAPAPPPVPAPAPPAPDALCALARVALAVCGCHPAPAPSKTPATPVAAAPVAAAKAPAPTAAPAPVLRSPSSRVATHAGGAAADWLGDASAWQFDVILVDPPRCGLDADTLRLVGRFEHILYVSCNPSALLDNLAAGGLDRSHAIRRFAVFDHFPYTRHVEVAVHLERRATP